MHVYLLLMKDISDIKQNDRLCLAKATKLSHTYINLQYEFTINMPLNLHINSKYLCIKLVIINH